MNLGIDFGSTYSMLSYYDSQNKVIRDIQGQDGSKYIPSVACLDFAGKLKTGHAAIKSVMRNPDITAYRAFKMLLNEADPDRLSQMHYDEEYTPRRIAKEFLRQQLIHARKCCAGKKFEKVVICVPEVWNQGIHTMSGKAILQEIFMELKEELDILDKVTVVSEPAAASAYFAYSYQQQTQTPYNGKMLIVDYGGGTLDISLASVASLSGEASKASMEIDIENKTGAGENHDKQIGDAGIAYLEGTVRLALQEAGFEDIPNDGELLQAIYAFEDSLIGKDDEIQEMIHAKLGHKVDRMKNEHEVFETLRYRDQPVNITYSILYRAYKQIIWPVLNQQLLKIKNESLDPLLKASAQGTSPNYVNELKIALVGGFGKFELVKQQVYDFFGIDREYVDGGREDAVCYGAALIAEGIVSLRKSAKLSMGLVSRIHNTDTFHFAITRKQLLDYGKVYYMPDPIFFGGACSDPDQVTWKFAVGMDDRMDQAYRLVPLPKTINELNKIKAARLYYFGFSVDDSDIYTFHVIPADDSGNPLESQAKTIRLGNFSDVFGPMTSGLELNIVRKIDNH